MQLSATTTPCSASEPAGFRLLRQALSWFAAAAAGLVAASSLVNLLGLRGDPNRFGSVGLAMASCALLAGSIVSVRRPRRFAVLALALVTIVALSFTGLGRNPAALTPPALHGTLHAAVGVPLILCVACVVLANQVAFWLARRHACACD